MKYVLFALCFLAPITGIAQTTQDVSTDEYYIGIVESIEPSSEQDPLFANTILQQVNVFLDVGSGRVVQAQYSDNQATEADDIHVGEKVLVLKTEAFVDQTQYIITDKYRLPSILWLFGLFFLSAVIFAKKKGFTSIIGLAASLAVLVGYTVPAIVGGSSPFLVATISAFIIAVLSISIAHGFSKQTGVALVSTLVSLTLALGLSQLFVSTAKLFGLGTEDAFSLTLAGLGNIDLQGLLLAGIIIGVLGVLDDVTTAQTATVKELAAAGVTEFKKLYKAANQVGAEHIVSLVNTLALAYVGASLPLLLLFSLNEGQMPYWAILNSQLITEEIVRTLIGSTVLVLAVPISTIFAAWFYAKYPKFAQEDRH